MKNDDNSLFMRKIYYLLIVFSIIILSMCSYFYIRMGLDNKVKNVLDYESSSDINYKVYLKKNNFLLAEKFRHDEKAESESFLKLSA